VSEGLPKHYLAVAKYLNRLAGRLEDRHQNTSRRARRGGIQRSEVAMSAITHPPKHLVREYLERRSREQKPPPNPEEIRRQLGWGMLMPTELKMVTSRS
jgi:hypothetical protein